MWPIFSLATANKWSDLCVKPTLRCVYSQLDVENALNLVSKISLLGDDRKQPERVY